jgi:uncharacterized phage protein (TIGR02218 family)
MGFTDHDRPLSFGGVTYEADAGFTASEMEARLGLAVDNMEAQGALRSDQLDPVRLRAGDFDHAAIEIWRVNWQDVNQRLLLRAGRLGDVSHGEAGFTAEVRGLSEALNVTRGRLYQFACDAALGDPRCGINLELPAYKATGVVLAAEGGRMSVSGLGSFASGFFTHGTLTWSGGSNAGRREEVKSHAKSVAEVVIDLWRETAFAIAAGDAFVIRAGCDKQFATCNARFNNAASFRGFPHIPGTDFLAGFPNRSDSGNDGGRRNA